MQASLRWLAPGLLLSYTLYGYLQEKIMSSTYGGVRFQSTVILVGFNRIVGIAVALYMQKFHLRNSLKPRHPLYSYASVSLFNFLSTLCQYEALKYVTFTTQTLGKCSKMVPVMVLGILVYGKRYSWRNYLAVMLITVGTCLYMTTSLITPSNKGVSTMRGLLLLTGYLLFDALASTTEARLFNKKHNQGIPQKGELTRNGNPLKRDEMVYDQMLWINICSLGVSTIIVLTNHQQSLGNFINIASSIHGPRLLLDVALLSLSASIGLISLLKVIATFGAVTSSTLMTGRQFLSIVLNGVAFRNAANVGMLGWIGIGYVASGVQLELTHKRKIKEEKMVGLSFDNNAKTGRERSQTILRHLLLPLAAGVLAHIFVTTTTPYNNIPQTIASELFPVTTSFEYANRTYSRGDIQRLSAETKCGEHPARQLYRETIPRTVLASWPRSGNTFVREMVEHSTGFYTVDVKCSTLREPKYFATGCKHPDNNFLVKDHVPEYLIFGEDDDVWLPRAESYDRAIQVLRNPLDAIWSFWHLVRSRLHHELRIEGVDILGLEHISELDRMAHSWVQHTKYWLSVEKPKLLLRYEDLRSKNQVQHLARTLEFLLPNEELPPMEHLICADNDEGIAYNSRKAEPFYSWDHFDPEIRSHILSIVKENWCSLGFETLLRQQRGHKAIDCT